jgi:hypothetical protein
MDATLDISCFTKYNFAKIYHLNESQVIQYYVSGDLFFDGPCPICTQDLNEWMDDSKSYPRQKLYCSFYKRTFTRKYATIFQTMRLPFHVFNLIIYYYTQGFTDLSIQKLLNPLHENIELKTIRKYTRIFRQMVHIYVQKELDSMSLEGPIEIDEACVYKFKRGRNGKLAKIRLWVFGLKCRMTKKSYSVSRGIQNTSNDNAPYSEALPTRDYNLFWLFFHLFQQSQNTKRKLFIAIWVYSLRH